MGSNTENEPVTQLLEQAIAQIQNLSVAQQDEIAGIILDEIADDRRWEEAFAASQDELSQLAAKVREDIRAGGVRPGGFDGR